MFTLLGDPAERHTMTSAQRHSTIASPPKEISAIDPAKTPTPIPITASAALSPTVAQASRIAQRCSRARPDVVSTPATVLPAIHSPTAQWSRPLSPD